MIVKWFVKIESKFEILNSQWHVTKVFELLDNNWAKFVWWENILTPIYMQCNNAMICIEQRIAVNNSGVSCLTDPDLDIWLELMGKTWFEAARHNYLYTPPKKKIHVFVVKGLKTRWSESDDICLISTGPETVCSHLAICEHWARQWTDTSVYLCHWAPAACLEFLRFPFGPVGA